MSTRQHLARVATALGELNEQVVFVGGATIDLYITDPAAGPPRFTEAAGHALKGYFARELSSLLASTAFTEAVPAHLLGDPGSQARAGVVLQRVRAIASAVGSGGPPGEPVS